MNLGGPAHQASYLSGRRFHPDRYETLLVHGQPAPGEKSMADLAAKEGARLDADAAPHWLALVTEDGKVYPLLKDAGSRLFFKDKALLNRPMRLLAKPLPGSQVLRVLGVHSLIKGVPHEVYYWCNVCSIRRGEKMTCECCGGPMELREEPVKK
jgi:hypothetical protein